MNFLADYGSDEETEQIVAAPSQPETNSTPAVAAPATAPTPQNLFASVPEPEQKEKPQKVKPVNNTNLKSLLNFGGGDEDEKPKKKKNKKRKRENKSKSLDIAKKLGLDATLQKKAQPSELESTTNEEKDSKQQVAEQEEEEDEFERDAKKQKLFEDKEERLEGLDDDDEDFVFKPKKSKDQEEDIRPNVAMPSMQQNSEFMKRFSQLVQTGSSSTDAASSSSSSAAVEKQIVAPAIPSNLGFVPQQKVQVTKEREDELEFEVDASVYGAPEEEIAEEEEEEFEAIDETVEQQPKSREELLKQYYEEYGMPQTAGDSTRGELPPEVLAQLYKPGANVVEVSGSAGYMNEAMRRRAMVEKHRMSIYATKTALTQVQKPMSAVGRIRNQISFLAHDMQERELELAEKMAEGRASRHTAAKRYGLR